MAAPNANWRFPRNRILVDFDGTLGQYSWPGLPDKPFNDAVWVLKELKALGFEIWIFTTRAWPGWREIDGEEFWQKQLTDMREWLAKWSVPYDGITHEKLPAMYIIDDRALNSDLYDWDEIFQIIKKSVNEAYGKVRGVFLSEEES